MGGAAHESIARPGYHTIRRPCESRDIRRGARSERHRSTAFTQQLKPVVMGPCFRRDDEENYADRASAPSIIATEFCKP
jgi:hypothetical protein